MCLVQGGFIPLPSRSSMRCMDPTIKDVPDWPQNLCFAKNSSSGGASWRSDITISMPVALHVTCHLLIGETCEILISVQRNVHGKLELFDPFHYHQSKNVFVKALEMKWIFFQSFFRRPSFRMAQVSQVQRGPTGCAAGQNHTFGRCFWGSRVCPGPHAGFWCIVSLRPADSGRPSLSNSMLWTFKTSDFRPFQQKVPHVLQLLKMLS